MIFYIKNKDNDKAVHIRYSESREKKEPVDIARRKYVKQIHRGCSGFKSIEQQTIKRPQ